MPLMYQYASLQMEWCLDCHHAIPKNTSGQPDKGQVFDMSNIFRRDKGHLVDGMDNQTDLGLKPD